MKLVDDMLTTSPELYEPKRMERTTQNSNKVQMAQLPDSNEQHRLDMTMQQCKIIYKALIEKGIHNRTGKNGITQSMMTEWIWSGTLYASKGMQSKMC